MRTFRSLNSNLFTALVLFCIIVFCTNNVYAQVRGLMYSKYYSAKEYKSGTQNWSVVEDSRGVLYVGNANGVLEFNGDAWRLIPLANSSTARSLAVDSSGLVYVGGVNEMGVLLANSNGELVYASLTNYLPPETKDFGEIWRITVLGDSIFFSSQQYLFCWHNNKFSYWQIDANRFYLTHLIGSDLVVQKIGQGLQMIKDSVLVDVNGSDFFANYRIHSIIPFNNKYLICTRSNGFFLANYNGKELLNITPFGNISPKARKLSGYFKSNLFYHGILLNDSLVALSSLSGEVMLVNSSWDVVDIINSESIGIVSPAYQLHKSKSGVLWMALDNGIAMVEALSPFRYWNEDMGVSGVIADVAELRDTLYIATGNGVFYTPASSENNLLLSHFKPVDRKLEQAWEFLYFVPPSPQWSSPYTLSDTLLLNHDEAILLVSSTTGLFQLNGSGVIRVSDYSRVLRLHQYSKNPKQLYLGLSQGLALVEYNKGKWIDKGDQFGISKDVNEIGEDQDGNLWLASNFNGIFKIPHTLTENPNSGKPIFYGDEKGIESPRSISIFDEYNPVVFSIDEHVYKYDSESDQFVDYWKGIEPDTTVTNSREISPSDMHFYRVQGDVLSLLYVAHLTDTVLWFSTNKGITRYANSGYDGFLNKLSTQIWKVTASDSVIFAGANYGKAIAPSDSLLYYLPNNSSVINFNQELNFVDNTLNFNYSLPFYEGSVPNVYSYYLEGYDKGWSDWKVESKKEYTNLPPRSYVFKVKARNLYGVESEISEYHFTILPPWYRTYVAYAFYVFCLIALVILIVKFYTYRLVQEKDKLEALVLERTQEILVQKEEILVQAEHLKDANEWITAKNSELEEKKNQLEVSDATKNKFFRIIAHDLRNPISTAVSTTEYILSNFDNSSSDSVKKFIEKLHRLSLTTYSLLENLLDWSTSQMGQIRYNPKMVELNFMVADSIDLVRSMIDSKRIEIAVDISPSIEVYADENMLRTVIRNLISNAVKFTPEGGCVKLSAQVTDKLCFFSIEDSGVGISEENMQNLFKIEREFKTLGTNNERGSGLGLIISKEFIELNGGTISVKSEQGKGSVFTISIKMS